MLVVAQAATALAAERRVSAELPCGGSVVTAETVLDIKPGVGRFWLGQTMRFQPKGAGKPTVVASAKSPLQAAVVSWACLPSGPKRYVLLSYNCERDDVGGECYGQNEWFRLLEPNGQRLDYGYKPQDRRYSELYSRLRIGAAMSAGVPMTAIDRDTDSK